MQTPYSWKTFYISTNTPKMRTNFLKIPLCLWLQKSHVWKMNVEHLLMFMHGNMRRDEFLVNKLLGGLWQL